MSNLTIGVSSKGYNNFTNALATSGVTTQATASTFIAIVGLTGGKTLNSVTDSFSNTWNLIGTSINFGFGSEYLQAAICVNGTGGASHTISANASDFGTMQVFFAEIIGYGTTYALLDSFATPTSGDTAVGTGIPSPTVTASGAASLIFAAIMAIQDGPNPPIAGDLLTDATGFNNILQSFTDGTSTTSAWPGGISAIANQPAGNYFDTFLFSSTLNAHNWGAFTIAFKPSATANTSGVIAWVHA